MTAIHLTEQERIQSLRRFGYAEREARFLSIAALHSGYFLRRQAVLFFSKEDGSSVPDLLEKVFRNSHATAAA